MVLGNTETPARYLSNGQCNSLNDTVSSRIDSPKSTLIQVRTYYSIAMSSAILDYNSISVLPEEKTTVAVKQVMGLSSLV